LGYQGASSQIEIPDLLVPFELHFGRTKVVNKTSVQLLRGYNKKHPRPRGEKLIYI
jgi:hypothetical protein